LGETLRFVHAELCADEAQALARREALDLVVEPSALVAQTCLGTQILAQFVVHARDVGHEREVDADCDGADRKRCHDAPK
jgi:hypothetical protein